MSANELLQTFVSGVSLGGTYAIVALGFVIVFSATGILNFAQGAFVIFGAYLTYQLGSAWGLPFALAVLGAMLVCGALAVCLELAVMRKLTMKQEFAAVMVTAGVLFCSEALSVTIWGIQPLNLGDPWGLRTVDVLGAAVSLSDIWTLIVSAALLGATFAFLNFTRGGLAMRACVVDREAAVAQGINPRRVSAAAWAVAGAAGGVAGAMLATGTAGVNQTLALASFAALPAMILGGLDSPAGAIVGGLVIGLIQQFTALLQPEYLEFLGSRFAALTPYIVLTIILLVRPRGLFGTRQVQRF
jgi:branched-chain amino acid transport system permease protein